ncbi:MAG: arabinogalactan endo-1,4-beta-galactosidase [Cyclobacteriaceae bacterium]|nr:arabinogalactan endo-1,4-beta-galactosidase [Cyclobacteriaceae bacterium]
MKHIALILFGLAILLSCAPQKEETTPAEEVQPDEYYIGGDFSIMKKMEDLGGEYKIDGVIKPGYEIFRDNGYNYARLRIFHTPNMEGPVCQDLAYTIATAKKAKDYGFKLLLNFHYSDTWADPGKQFKPAAWESASFEGLVDSVNQYTRLVLNEMDKAGVLPEMVQIGNEITPGMLWPEGKIWKPEGPDWESISTLLKSGIQAVHEVYGDREVQVMIHTDSGGDKEKTETFFNNISSRGVAFDLIGLSYYPWWHGTFEDLKGTLRFVSENFAQDIVLVETAYYSNGYYPEPGEWVIDYQPYPPTEQGQYDYLVALNKTLHAFAKVKGVFYWKPDGLEIPGSGVNYLGRSLFSPTGDAYKGIGAWKGD